MSQTVSETDAPESQAAEEEAGTETLESLLAQYEQDSDEGEPSSEPDSPEPTGKKDGETVSRAEFEALQRQIRRREEEEFRRQTNDDLRVATSQLAEALSDGPVGLSQDAIETWLHGKAVRDDRLLRAFVNRHNNPEGFQRVLKAVAGELRESFSVDPTYTANRAAVESAVRGANRKPPVETPKLGPMSDADFERYKRSL